MSRNYYDTNKIQFCKCINPDQRQYIKSVSNIWAYNLNLISKYPILQALVVIYQLATLKLIQVEVINLNTPLLYYNHVLNKEHFLLKLFNIYDQVKRKMKGFASQIQFTIISIFFIFSNKGLVRRNCDYSTHYKMVSIF